MYKITKKKASPRYGDVREKRVFTWFPTFYFDDTTSIWFWLEWIEVSETYLGFMWGNQWLAPEFETRIMKQTAYHFRQEHTMMTQEEIRELERSAFFHGWQTRHLLWKEAEIIQNKKYPTLRLPIITLSDGKQYRRDGRYSKWEIFHRVFNQWQSYPEPYCQTTQDYRDCADLLDLEG